WYVTGGTDAGRVFHSEDQGGSWSVAATPIRNDSPSAGIFSLAFADARRGMIVGGDYSKDKEYRGNIAVTKDGRRTWTAPSPGPKGFRSAVAYLTDRQVWVFPGTEC